MSKILQQLLDTVKQSPWFIIISLSLVLLSSIITIWEGGGTLKEIYFNTSYGERKYWLEKIGQLTPSAHIKYFEQTIGHPIFVNDYTRRKEYIFFNKYFFIVAITDEKDKVLAYSVTTRKEYFNPAILLGPYTLDGTVAKIKLGKSTFSEIDKVAFGEPKITASIGAHVYSYDEEYYFGNPGNYQSYIFTLNQAGYTRENDFAPTTDKELNLSNPELRLYRARTVINTYTVTSPMVDGEALEYYCCGPRLDQVRIIPNFNTR